MAGSQDERLSLRGGVLAAADAPAHPVQPAPPLLEEQSWALRSVTVALASRAGIFIVGFLGALLGGARHVSDRLLDPQAAVFAGTRGDLFNVWAHWDGVWYVRVAAHGYQTVRSSAFFPLYPYIVRYTRFLFGSYQVAGILVSLACFIGACMLLYRLLSDDFGKRVAFGAVLFMSLFPTSFFFQAVYRESLFLLVSVACFYFARRSHWLTAGLMGLLACLTHAGGILLMIPVAVMVFEQSRSTTGWDRHCLVRGAAGLLLIPLGLVIYMGVLAQAFGQPLAFLHVQQTWGRTLSAPWTTAWQGLVAGCRGALWLVSGQALGGPPTWPRTPAIAFANLIGAITLVGAAALIVLGRRKLPVAYLTYAIAVVAYPLFFSGGQRPLLSLPRLILPAFPLFLTLALVSERRPLLRWTLVGLSSVALAYLTVRFAQFKWVA
jgi:hypothetical protein